VYDRCVRLDDCAAKIDNASAVVARLTSQIAATAPLARRVDGSASGVAKVLHRHSRPNAGQRIATVHVATHTAVVHWRWTDAA
jgi:hypothetical protein